MAATIVGGDCKSFLIGSDTKKKDKSTVVAFVFYLYENHIEVDENISNEIIWSDGPSCEFKNKFTMQILKDFCNITWERYY